MPVGRAAKELNAVAGLGYTGASVASWAAYLYEYIEGKTPILLGTWKNGTSTYTKGSAAIGTGVFLLVIADENDDVDIAEGDTIDVDNSSALFTDFSVVMPAIVSADMGDNDELWLFLDGASSWSWAVPFTCARKFDQVAQPFVAVAQDGLYYKDTAWSADSVDNDGDEQEAADAVGAVEAHERGREVQLNELLDLMDVSPDAREPEFSVTTQLSITEANALANDSEPFPTDPVNPQVQ